MLLDGKKIAEHILDQLKIDVAALPMQPIFCDILVGNDPVSLSYVKIKGKTAESCGITFLLVQLPEDILQSQLEEKIRELQSTPSLCGLILQLPLPNHLDRQQALNAIGPELDVDCLGSQNSDLLYAGKAALIPPTAAAILKMVEALPQSQQSGKFVVVGQGQLVGKPITALLRQQGKDVAVTDKTTQNLPEITKTADVLICGTGQAGLIDQSFVKSGAAVIDAGTAEIDGGIVGDVNFESVREIAGFLTPVPGGVGPITVSMLLYNVVAVAKKKLK